MVPRHGVPCLDWRQCAPAAPRPLGLPPELLARPGASLSSREPRQPTQRASPLDLTDRQLAVLRLLAKGAPNKSICRELGLAERTVKAHVTAVLRALKVSSRTQAAVEAIRLGLAEPEG